MWNPPALTATEEGQEEDSVATKPSGADDDPPSQVAAATMLSPFNSLGFADIPRSNIQGDRRSYPPEYKNESNKKLCLGLNPLTYSMSENANLNNVKNEKSEFIGESDTSNLKTEDHVDFMPPWCESAIDYPIKAHGAEAKNIPISMSFSACSTSVLPIDGNFSITGNNDINNIVPPPYTSSQQNVNGNFLSLGIGGGAEVKSNSNFSTREISAKVGDHVSLQYGNSIVGQSSTNPWNLTPSTGFASGPQTNGSGLSSSALAGSRLHPIQFPGFQTPQANPQSSFSAMSDNFVFYRSPSSSLSGIPMFPQCEGVTQSPLRPQIPRPTPFASQFILPQQQYSRRSSITASSESSRNYLSDGIRGSSISHAQLGRLIPMTEARTQSITGLCFPGCAQPVGYFTSQVEGARTGVANSCSSPSGVQPVVNSDTSHNPGSVVARQNSLYPERYGFPIPRVSAIQSATSGPFPRRLGVQQNEPTVRTIGGTPAIHLPAQGYPFRPLVLSGHHNHGMPAQLPMGFPRAEYFSGQVTPGARFGVRPQGYPFVSHPHLKRQATVNPSTAPSGQRRKISHQPVAIHHSGPSPRPSFPADPAPIPATSPSPLPPDHIKWRGFDEPLEPPSGHKCFLCKRDLSFTSEGQVYQPANPLAVSVLPCGHTFHDDCLQRITVEGDSKNPICIPCAIGDET